ncbi:MAG TPA: hypothetical protein VM285_01415, partial [Polyangia bacterium]|nr:hypothetical protein [Polyangia bacterium]
RRAVAVVLADRGASIVLLVQVLVMGGLLAGAAISGSELFLRFTPFLLSVLFFGQFAFSLRGTPIIERFARLKRTDLPPDHVRYCRGLTRIWLLVFLGNSAIVLTAAFVESKPLWALLVGPVSYLYLGVFIAGEYVLRKRRFQEFDPASPIDRLLRPLVGAREP